jgi:toxin ParE1/3/4
VARSLVFSPLAAADIDRIYDYTEAHWGPEQAESYTFELRTICRRLCETPRPGHSAADVRKGYFVCPTGSHNIFFREEKLRIVIVRILHNRMDPSRHL